MKILLCMLALVCIYIIWQKIELTRFRITNYDITSDKIKEETKLMVLADLHCHEYGKHNQRLVKAMQEQRPDIILVPGDLIVGKHTETYHISYELMKEAVKIAPVYFCNGNHESRPAREKKSYTPQFLKYQESLKKLGVIFLNNAEQKISVKGNEIHLYGIEIPLKCYDKGHKTLLPDHFMEEQLGRIDEECFSVLMAHNPAYGREYAAWGADLTVSGHTHGGLVRIPGLGSVVSPQFEFFPEFDAGEFELNGKKLIISKGLGTHTFHIRVFDRAELVMVTLKPEKYA